MSVNGTNGILNQKPVFNSTLDSFCAKGWPQLVYNRLLNACFPPFLPFIGELYGLEKLWAFRKYYKNGAAFEIKDELMDKLDQYKTIDDFRLKTDISRSKAGPSGGASAAGV